MLKGDDIKRLVKRTENWQVEFKLAKGGVHDTFWELCSAFTRTDGGCRSFALTNNGVWDFMI